MSNVERISLTRNRRAPVLGWVGTAAAGVFGIILVWISVQNGPEICGLGFAGDWACFAVNRWQIGWIATAAACVGWGASALAALLFRSAWWRRWGWALALGVIVVSTGVALFVLR
jgi:hypothetical protein